MSEREYKPPPAFQFYPADFMMGAAAMSKAERGDYITLLCYQWNHRSIPSDPGKQRRICGGPVSSAVIAKFPPDEQGEMKNVRLELERQKQDAWREKSAAGGRRSGESRRGTVVQPPLNHPMKDRGNQKATLQSSSSSSVQSMRESTRAHEAERPGLEEVLAHAQTIGLAEWKARDWFDEMEGCGWLDFNHRPIAKWQPVLVRVKTKWEADGRPAGPPAARAKATNGSHDRPLSVMDIKTIIQAKEETAAKIKREFASDTAIDTVWSDNAKRSEWLKLRAEIKKLKERLSGMA